MNSLGNDCGKPEPATKICVILFYFRIFKLFPAFSLPKYNLSVILSISVAHVHFLNFEL